MRRKGNLNRKVDGEVGIEEGREWKGEIGKVGRRRVGNIGREGRSINRRGLRRKGNLIKKKGRWRCRNRRRTRRGRGPKLERDEEDRSEIQ